MTSSSMEPGTPGHDPNSGLPVIYRDNHLLVIDKPAGLLSQADRTGDADVLTLGREYLKKEYGKPGNVFLGLVHRLDRPASGVMVLARTSKAAARLSEQVRRREVKKHYLAVVEGAPGQAGAWTDHVKKQDERVRVVSARVAGAQEASLSFRSVVSHAGATLVHVVLETGRPHQVRLQFSSRGHPIVGDFRYGSKRELDGRNLALHCAAMGVVHPTLKSEMMWRAFPPITWPHPLRVAAIREIEALDMEA